MSRPSIGLGWSRWLVYPCLAVWLGCCASGLYSRYLAAETERLDAALRQQVLEHRRRAMLAHWRNGRIAARRG